ncbi:MAG: isoaspartyl peptidase/L-asparaginase [Bacteroidetes bacterium]|nr:isoaspartyl peptidase/L-asparaginase [Bacteroidota bacterium]HET6245171.1 isoaspartyl peptidase/L-asparaginase [Bacteroidia bacterium]
MEKWGIAIHGGAGRLPFYGMTPEREKDYLSGLKKSLERGYKILEKGGTSLDAVENSIKILENDPLFNAGKGSVFTTHGNNRMDASIMCGKTMKAGAICRVMFVKNPIALARALMENPENIFLGDEGAQDYAMQIGLEMMPPHYFFTQERYDQWQEEKKKRNQEEHGTVGAVALDQEGNLAAGTSTGGLINKNEFRIGDSALIGAGTYANNKTCAVSCTGKGESIIRAVVAHEISSMLLYHNIDLNQACEKTMKEKLTPFGGHAGLVAMDKEGNVKFIHNSHRMYRGYKGSGEKTLIELY